MDRESLMTTIQEENSGVEFSFEKGVPNQPTKTEADEVVTPVIKSSGKLLSPLNLVNYSEPSPAKSIDSMGFKHITPLNILSTEHDKEHKKALKEIEINKSGDRLSEIPGSFPYQSVDEITNENAAVVANELDRLKLKTNKKNSNGSGQQLGQDVSYGKYRQSVASSLFFTASSGSSRASYSQNNSYANDLEGFDDDSTRHNVTETLHSRDHSDASSSAFSYLKAAEIITVSNQSFPSNPSASDGSKRHNRSDSSPSHSSSNDDDYGFFDNGLMEPSHVFNGNMSSRMATTPLVGTFNIDSDETPRINQVNSPPPVKPNDSSTTDTFEPKGLNFRNTAVSTTSSWYPPNSNTNAHRNTQDTINENLNETDSDDADASPNHESSHSFHPSDEDQMRNSRMSLQISSQETNDLTKRENSSSQMNKIVSNHSSQQPELVDDDYTYSSLYVVAIHKFDASTLQSGNHSSICLSFDKGDLVFTYLVDKSGWGEVILLNTLKRGWVPMNYFKPAIPESIPEQAKSLSPNAYLAFSKKPLARLFVASAKFLLEPTVKPIYLSTSKEIKGYSFDNGSINGIRDGVRRLLEDTNCISRTTDVVKSKPIIRKVRKSLLRDWYNLMVKAQQYRNTIDITKIEILQLMVYQVVRKAIAFLEIWGLESESIASEPVKVEKINQALRSETMTASEGALPCLSESPFAKDRLQTIYKYSISYLSLIMGRLDIIENNYVGCKYLENLTHQIINLMKELLLIGKTCQEKLTDYSNHRSQLVKLDNSLDTILSHISELVTSVKVFISRTMNQLASQGKKQLMDNYNQTNGIKNLDNDENYYYTIEGGKIIKTCSKMVVKIGEATATLKGLLDITNDFQLPGEKQHIDFDSAKVDASAFIKACSESLMKNNQISAKVQKHVQSNRSVSARNVQDNRKSKRFSMFKSGVPGGFDLKPEALDSLSNFLPDVTPSSPFISNDEEFTKFQHANENSTSDELKGYEYRNDLNKFHDVYAGVESEIVRSNEDGTILGASFRALVYMLTNEATPPNYFFISVFFLTFRIFSTSNDLLEELVIRCDIDDKQLKNESKMESVDRTTADTLTLKSKLTSRRRLICNTFRLWMESYWKHSSDYPLLATLINFFNEGISEYLPLEAMKLLEIASNLMSDPPVENDKDRFEYYNSIANTKQLVKRKIIDTREARGFSGLSFLSSGIEDEVNELERIETTSSISSRLSQKSFALPSSRSLVTLGSLLSDQDNSKIRALCLGYRRMLQGHWQANTYNDAISKQFPTIETDQQIEMWWKICQERWKLPETPLTLLNFNINELAKQLTLLESRLFCSIKVEELLNQNFTAKKLDLNLSPNIHRSVLFTNCLSEYVLDSILTPSLSSKQRSGVFKQWLKVGASCLELRNYNSLAAIMTSLQSFLLTRINELIPSLSTKNKGLYDYLITIIHPEKNYSVYRGKLRAFLESSSSKIPIVPYLSLFLQDLTFVVDGNPNYRKSTSKLLPQKLINVDKYYKVTSIVSNLEELQVPYPDIPPEHYNMDNLFNKLQGQVVGRRFSVFSRTSKASGIALSENSPKYGMTGIPEFQELILLEIWKIKQLNLSDEDRAWKMSCKIQPRGD
ncbi:hypothetical protein LJB42_002626 [Komagataella kurtzmanii]|nr:hypothetical protein LJB42_002626 [Komagataella kurtzmanii]